MPCVESFGPEEYSVMARRNASLGPAGKVLFLSLIASVSLLIGLGFAWFGAWPVLPFAGAEVLAVVLAFRIAAMHADDFERLTISGERLTIETGDLGRRSREDFHRYWAKVVLRQDAGRFHLAFRSHGREVEFGRLLSDEQKLALAGRIRERLSRP